MAWATGRTIIVTGAAGGIGAATARRLASEGACLALCDHPRLAPQLAALTQELGSAVVTAVSFDVCDERRMETEVGALLEAAQRIDGLVNTIGLYADSLPVLGSLEERWDQIWNINFKAALRLTRSVMPRMLKTRGGSIVHVTSDSAFDILAGECPYGISKIALARLVAYAARETTGDGVRINAIAPGYVRTDMTRPIWDDDAARTAATAGIPLRRFGEPAEIAAVAVFLLSDEASYVHGQCLLVDGGRNAGRLG